MATFSWQRSVTAFAFLAALTLAGRPAIAEEGTAEQRIEEVLAQKLNPKEFVETPLADVMKNLAAELSIPIQFDLKAMADGTVTVDTPVSITLADVSVESALALILEPLDLTVVIKHEVLLVTTMTEAEGILTTKVYPVGDLLPARDTISLNSEGPYEELIDVIHENIAPTSWDEVGGPGSVDSYGVARAIVVTQTRAIHRQIRDLLAQLRSVSSSAPAEGAAAATETIEGVELQDLPYLKIYRLDNRYTGAGGGMGGQLSVAGSGAEPTQPPVDSGAQELAAAIPALVAPETWDSVGGSGSIRAVKVTLLVRQHRHVHEQIAQLLKALGL